MKTKLQFKKPSLAILSGGIQIEKLSEDAVNDLVKQINALGLPKEVTSDEVYVRPVKLTGDALNSKGGRFKTEDLEHILELTNGAPMIIAHDLGTLPIAKFFGGQLVKENEVTFIQPYFYWMKNHSGAEDLKSNIDGGIYSEVSLGFHYDHLECSICGKDYLEYDYDERKWKCPHILGDEYEGELCFVWYNTIQSVDEGSIVFRGAHPGTGFGHLDQNDQLQKLTDEKKKFLLDNKVEGEMDLKKVALALGLPEGSSAKEILDAIQKNKDDLTNAEFLASIGRDVQENLREDVLGLATAKAGLKNEAVSENLKSTIKNADYQTFQSFRETFSEGIDETAGQYKCPHCEKPVNGLRLSVDQQKKAEKTYSVQV